MSTIFIHTSFYAILFYSGILLLLQLYVNHGRMLGLTPLVYSSLEQVKLYIQQRQKGCLVTFTAENLAAIVLPL